MSDIEPKTSREELECKATSLLAMYEQSQEGLNLEQFADALRREDTLIPQIDRLLHLERSYFEAKRLAKTIKTKPKDGTGSQYSNSDSSGASKPKSKSKSKTKEVLCSYHSEKKYDYGMHAVTLDTTGRCVDPCIISESKFLFLGFYFESQFIGYRLDQTMG